MQKYVVIINELPADERMSGISPIVNLEVEVEAASRLEARRKACDVAYSNRQGRNNRLITLTPEQRPAHICEVYEA